MNYLTDTSVFIDYFRGKQVNKFVERTERGEVLVSSLVRLELLKGIEKDQWRPFLEGLSKFDQPDLNSDHFLLVETFIYNLKDSGLSGGIVDLLLASQAKILGAKLWTHDLKLKAIAKALSIDLA